MVVFALSGFFFQIVGVFRFHRDFKKLIPPSRHHRIH